MYWEESDEINCEFFKDGGNARIKVAALIEAQEQASTNAEHNVNLDITLMEIIGEVIETPEGARLVNR